MATSINVQNVEQTIQGATDGTPIGNVGDKMKVIDQDAITQLTLIASALGAGNLAILKQNEVSITTRTETDVSGVTHTVTTGKKFILYSFIGSYDAQATIHLRLKKQTGGSGAFSTVARITLEVGGQGQSTIPINFGNGVYIGNAGDVFKVTVESSIIKGTIWTGFVGVEI